MEINLTVTRDYMLRKDAGPSAAKLLFDTRAVPLAVNMAGSLEVALNRAAARSGLRPSLILAVLAGAGALAVLRLVRASRRTRTRRAV